MTANTQTRYPSSLGYMTESIRGQYIKYAVGQKLLPEQAHRLEPVISLTASTDMSKPIMFWQLFSVLGPERIVAIVQSFYDRVYEDEHWFRSVFERISGKHHHVQTQSAMWIDAMGGGHAYHGAEFRLSFHHKHNAFKLMNSQGAQRWVELMKSTLDDPAMDFADDPRVRPAINTFLAFFLDKYAQEFDFTHESGFGATNPPWRRRINFMTMTTEAIEELPEQSIAEELTARGIDIDQLQTREQLVNKALSL